MHKFSKSFFIALALTAVIATSLYAWGFWGHKKINRMAVFTLPSAMLGFYKTNIEFVTEHAVDPDKRRYGVKEEAPRHYIDLDHYGLNPFDTLPEFWNDAVKKFTEDTLNNYGIVPWYSIAMLSRLTNAMKEGNTEKILHYSADLGHYVADAHVPLHCTENYNGQLTGQDGIHGFWESRLPELFGGDYDYIVGQAVYIKNPQKFMWQVVRESFNAKDSVLNFEAALNKKMAADEKYEFEQRGSSTVKVYSENYSKAYDNMLNGMVERRMRQAIIAVGSMWYTAWVNAGMPDLNNMRTFVASDALKKQMEEEDKMWRTGKPVGNTGHVD